MLFVLTISKNVIILFAKSLRYKIEINTSAKLTAFPIHQTVHNEN
jgi:hypothetical protein